MRSRPRAWARRPQKATVDEIAKFVPHVIVTHPLPAPSRVNVALIDAEMTSWYGSRAIAGLRYMSGLRRSLSAVGTV